VDFPCRCGRGHAVMPTDAWGAHGRGQDAFSSASRGRARGGLLLPVFRHPFGSPSVHILAKIPWGLFTMPKSISSVQVPSTNMVRVKTSWGVKLALSAVSPLRQIPCQIVSNDLGLISNFTRVCLGYFGATLSIEPCGFGFWN
jgi:hypothetical protein